MQIKYTENSLCLKLLQFWTADELKQEGLARNAAHIKCAPPARKLDYDIRIMYVVWRIRRHFMSVQI